MRRRTWLPAVLAVLWAGSWTIIALEIFRWHHMSRTLRFTAPVPPPGMPAHPHPGMAVLAACLCACAAPAALVGVVLIRRPRDRRATARRAGVRGDARRPPGRG